MRNASKSPGLAPITGRADLLVEACREAEEIVFLANDRCDQENLRLFR